MGSKELEEILGNNNNNFMCFIKGDVIWGNETFIIKNDPNIIKRFRLNEKWFRDNFNPNKIYSLEITYGRIIISKNEEDVKFLDKIKDLFNKEKIKNFYKLRNKKIVIDHDGSVEMGIFLNKEEALVVNYKEFKYLENIMKNNCEFYLENPNLLDYIYLTKNKKNKEIRALIKPKKMIKIKIEEKINGLDRLY